MKRTTEADIDDRVWEERWMISGRNIDPRSGEGLIPMAERAAYTTRDGGIISLAEICRRGGAVRIPETVLTTADAKKLIEHIREAVKREEVAS